jgi:hypothetical protein
MSYKFGGIKKKQYFCSGFQKQPICTGSGWETKVIFEILEGGSWKALEQSKHSRAKGDSLGKAEMPIKKVGLKTKF